MLEQPNKYDTEGLLTRLDTAIGQINAEYLSLLLDGHYKTAVEKLAERDLLEMHRQNVEEL